ncbi:MAG: HPr kinase/phosphorylase, partial [Christensenellales bacterium]
MVKASDFQKTLELEVIHAGSNSRLNIEDSDINRPGLQLAGFLDYFPHERPQVLGKVEMTYLNQLEPQVRYERLKRFMSYDLPCVTICRSIRCPAELKQLAEERDIWVFSSPLPTSKFVLNITNYLNNRLAPRITRHGVLVDVYG